MLNQFCLINITSKYQIAGNCGLTFSIHCDMFHICCSRIIHGTLHGRIMWLFSSCLSTA